MHKLKKWPSEFEALPKYEKAFVIAAVQMKMENDKKQEQESKRQTKKGKNKK